MYKALKYQVEKQINKNRQIKIYLTFEKSARSMASPPNDN